MSGGTHMIFDSGEGAFEIQRFNDYYPRLMANSLEERVFDPQLAIRALQEYSDTWPEPASME